MTIKIVGLIICVIISMCVCFSQNFTLNTLFMSAMILTKETVNDLIKSITVIYVYESFTLSLKEWIQTHAILKIITLNLSK